MINLFVSYYAITEARQPVFGNDVMIRSHVPNCADDIQEITALLKYGIGENTGMKIETLVILNFKEI